MRSERVYGRTVVILSNEVPYSQQSVPKNRCGPNDSLPVKGVMHPSRVTSPSVVTSRLGTNLKRGILFSKDILIKRVFAIDLS